eukprot:SAG22_NODE_7636_length_721_cov_1.401929_1_plen_29_part_10
MCGRIVCGQTGNYPALQSFEQECAVALGR